MMKWFNNISIRSKLFLSFSVIIVAMAIATVYGFNTIKLLQATQKTLQEVFFANAIDLSDLQTNVNESRVVLMFMVNPNKPGVQQSLFESIERLAKETDQSLNRLRERNLNDPKLVNRLHELSQIWSEFNKIRDEQTLPLIQAGKFDEAKELLFGSQREGYLKVRDMVDGLYDSAVKEANIEGERSIQKVNEVITLLGGFMVLVLLVSIVMAVFLNRTIVSPLKEITNTAEKIATGDLNVTVPAYDRKDEVGSLARGFEVMVGSLQKISKGAELIADGDLTVTIKPRSAKDMLALSFGIMTENLRGLVQEIQEGSNDLQSLSAETTRLATQIVADAKEIENAVAETTTNLEKARKVTEMSTQQEVWLALMESAVERIQRASGGGAASAQQVMVATRNLDEVGSRMRLFVGKLRV